MEKLDRRILSLLARDGRMSYTDIGKETGLSTSAAQQRVRRLEQRGVIKGYTAILDSAELGLMVTAFVSIRPFDPSQADDAPERLQHIEEIVSCYSVAGEANYLLKV
jgi:Lrp/AsnC family transcriptional regulator, leucine-responsive regulatory protein